MCIPESENPLSRAPVSKMPHFLSSHITRLSQSNNIIKGWISSFSSLCCSSSCSILLNWNVAGNSSMLNCTFGHLANKSHIPLGVEIYFPGMQKSLIKTETWEPFTQSLGLVLPLKKCEVLCLETCEVSDTVVHGKWSRGGGKPEGTRLIACTNQLQRWTSSGFFHSPDQLRAFNTKHFDLPGMREEQTLWIWPLFLCLWQDVRHWKKFASWIKSHPGFQKSKADASSEAQSIIPLPARSPLVGVPLSLVWKK